jgi:hypothetical protein
VADVDWWDRPQILAPWRSPVDVAALTAFLAPCLGFLLGSGKAVAEAASEKFGEQLWNHANRLWAKLSPAVEEKAAEKVAEHPDDEGARDALGRQIKEALEADPALAAEVERLWDEAQRVVVAGERGVATGGSITDSTIVTGDQNIVRDGR